MDGPTRRENDCDKPSTRPASCSVTGSMQIFASIYELELVQNTIFPAAIKWRTCAHIFCFAADFEHESPPFPPARPRADRRASPGQHGVLALVSWLH